MKSEAKVRLAVGAMLALYALLTISAFVRESATYDENTHLVAGYSYWRWNDYRLNPEHPPFLKRLAALPLLARTVWPDTPEPPAGRFPVAGAAGAAAGARSSDGRPGDRISRNAIQTAWASVFLENQNQWYFSHYFLNGIKDEAYRRIGTDRPLAIPGEARLLPGDFLNDARALFLPARLVMTLLSVFLGLLIFVWSRELFGTAGGLVSLALFCLDPNFLAHGGLVTTDVGFALFLFATIYFFRRACRGPSRRDTLLAVLFFSLAAASKFSAVLLGPMLILLALTRPRRGFRILALCLLAGWIFIWANYGFRFSAARDPKHAAEAATEIARQRNQALPRGHDAGRPALELTLRDSDVWEAAEHERNPSPQSGPAPLSAGGRMILLADRLRLLPEAYLFGAGFAGVASTFRASFLLGRLSDQGWWYYFPLAFLLKTPLVTLAAMAAAAYFLRRRRRARGALDGAASGATSGAAAGAVDRATSGATSGVANRRGESSPGLPGRSELIWLLVPPGVYLLASMTSHLNIGYRHLFPMLPFLFVLCGALGRVWEGLAAGRRKRAALIAGAALVLNTNLVLVRPAVVWPHYLAYFNELAGGPANGYRCLVDSNLDWGQELPALRSWIAAHGVSEPVQLCYFGTSDPHHEGIRFVNLPGSSCFTTMVPFDSLKAGRPIVISATCLQGVYFFPELRAAWREYLKDAKQVDTIGHSLFVYRRD